jgi:gas vesicle protein GvpN
VSTVLHARPRRFVNTPAVERVATRALRYLQSGFSVHLRGPAGTGKTTLALHLADLLSRPLMLLFGDDEFKTSDLIGNQSGYTRKKVIDNYIHSVVKVEDELRQNWVDSRLTLACREGFTLVYDEFNRSRPEVNNVLLSALEEKLLVLPPNNNRTEYIRVNPHFRAILTSNPEEYCGVHSTQDALLDRLVTINMPEPDELTQQEIVVQKSGIDRESALIIVQLVQAFRNRTQTEKSSGLRSCLMLAKVCHEHEILVMPENSEFREVCQDVLLSRASLPLPEATQALWDLFNELICSDPVAVEPSEPWAEQPEQAIDFDLNAEPDLSKSAASNVVESVELNSKAELPASEPAELSLVSEPALELVSEPVLAEVAAQVPYEQEVYDYLQSSEQARPSEIEAALGITRFQTVNALRALTEKGLLTTQAGAEKPFAYQVQR